MRNIVFDITRNIIFPIIILSVAISIFSCRPEPGHFPPGDLAEADTVYYEDLIIFISENDSPRDIVVCQFGREKKGDIHSGEFWGCIFTDGKWVKLGKTGKYRLLSSKPSIPEGPPGVTIKGNNGNFRMEYIGVDYQFKLKTGHIPAFYKPCNNDNLKEHYGFGKGRLEIEERKSKGRVFYIFTRWVGYSPVTTKYRKRYHDFNRYFLFNKDTYIIAKENHSNLGEFAITYNLSHTPRSIGAQIKAGRFSKTFDTFKTIITDRMYDLALFRIPYGWEIQFDDKNSVVLAGEGYYLDNKILTGRAIIEVSGALNSRGRDYELTGICEFIK